jgi:LytS/YehU family sensor histidine kinase
MISLIIAFIVEIVSLTESSAKLELLSERLEKENLNSQYDALKNQVNPHFLFNSLNVLSSLIYVDAKKADKFIGEFSKVFRYVLELNKEPFVKVIDEIKFLDSYMFLQRIRFDDNISFNTKLDQEALNLLIPPLTLQLLIENAIKHNIISDTKKLNISIESDNLKLIVKNKFQPRQEDVKSTGVGLNNLKEKYNIISERVPEFYEENGFFIAEIPLIKSEV